MLRIYPVLLDLVRSLRPLLRAARPGSGAAVSAGPHERAVEHGRGGVQSGEESCGAVSHCARFAARGARLSGGRGGARLHAGAGGGASGALRSRAGHVGAARGRALTRALAPLVPPRRAPGTRAAAGCRRERRGGGCRRLRRWGGSRQRRDRWAVTTRVVAAAAARVSTSRSSRFVARPAVLHEQAQRGGVDAEWLAAAAGAGARQRGERERRAGPRRDRRGSGRSTTCASPTQRERWRAQRAVGRELLRRVARAPRRGPRAARWSARARWRGATACARCVPACRSAGAPRAARRACRRRRARAASVRLSCQCSRSCSAPLAPSMTTSGPPRRGLARCTSAAQPTASMPGGDDQRGRGVHAAEALELFERAGARRDCRRSSALSRAACSAMRLVAAGFEMDDVLEPLALVVDGVGAGDGGELALARARQRRGDSEQRADAVGEHADSARLFQRHGRGAAAARHQDEAERAVLVEHQRRRERAPCVEPRRAVAARPGGAPRAPRAPRRAACAPAPRAPSRTAARARRPSRRAGSRPRRRSALLRG